MIQILLLRITLFDPSGSLARPPDHRYSDEKNNIAIFEPFKGQHYEAENQILRCQYGHCPLKTHGGNHHLRLQPTLCKASPNFPTPPPGH